MLEIFTPASLQAIAGCIGGVIVAFIFILSCSGR